MSALVRDVLQWCETDQTRQRKAMWMSEGGLEVERQRGTNFIYFPTALRTGQGTTSGNFRKMKKYIKSITV